MPHGAESPSDRQNWVASEPLKGVGGTSELNGVPGEHASDASRHLGNFQGLLLSPLWPWLQLGEQLLVPQRIFADLAADHDAEGFTTPVPLDLQHTCTA